MPVTLIKSRWASGSLIFHESGNFGDAANVLTLAQSAVTIGNASNDVDFVVNLTGSGSVTIDYGAGTVTLNVAHLALGDSDELRFGDATGGDVSVVWNGTNLAILPATDNVGVIQVGNDGTKSMDVK